MGDSMLQGCGSCMAQTVPILLNPLVWLTAIAAVTAMVSKGKKVGKK
jgi:hypothetical protein